MDEFDRQALHIRDVAFRYAMQLATIAPDGAESNRDRLIENAEKITDFLTFGQKLNVKELLVDEDLNTPEELS